MNANFKQKVKDITPKEIINTRRVVRRFLHSIILKVRYFFRRQLPEYKLVLIGIYFTLFIKIYRNNHITIHIPFKLTDFKFRSRFVLNNYEVEESKSLYTFLSAEAQVLELGGCLGYVSCITNRILKDKSKHVVLEANPNLIYWLNKNKNENKCGFAIENAIISNKASNVFYIHNLIVGGSSKRKTDTKIEIKGISIKYLEKKYNLKFDTLIMDIEGGELDFLRSNKMNMENIKTIFFEVHPFHNILTIEEAKECELILQDLDYDMILRIGNYRIFKKKS